MRLGWFLLIMLGIWVLSYGAGVLRAKSLETSLEQKLHSLPKYYGYFTAIWAVLPALVVGIVGFFFLPSIYFLFGIGVSLLGFGFAWRQIAPDFRARNRVERFAKWLLILCASIAILTTLAIVLSMISESFRFFTMYPILDFLFGTEWAIASGGRESSFGFLPLLWGTIYISVVALLVAVPLGLFSAIYLSEYAGPKLRAVAKPALEILAGIPTIVYGLFALLTVGPLLIEVFGRDGFFYNVLDFQERGLQPWMQDARSVLTAGLVMGIMLIPFISSLSDDIINAVPQAMRDGSYGLGATQSETVRNVILPAALPGIIGAFLLAASRAIGETMIVVMGAGAAAKFALSPLEGLTTITTRIVAQLTGDGSFDSPETLVAYALGLTLFLLTLALNIYAHHIVQKYKEQYE